MGKDCHNNYMLAYNEKFEYIEYMLKQLQELVNLTTLPGYDATKKQTLKNDNGEFKWEDDVAEE